MLIEGRHVFLVAGEAIESLGEHNLKQSFPRILEEALVARSEPGRAALRAIGVGDRKGPAFGLDPRLAEADLILDRGVALKVRGVAGVNGGAHGLPHTHGMAGIGELWRRRRISAWRRRFASTIMACT